MYHCEVKGSEDAPTRQSASFRYSTSPSLSTPLLSASPSCSVPMRKARSPTAVLEALSSTVRVEGATVPYDLLDDPYLLPLTDLQTRDYRMARASGRRVAKRIVEDFPYFFDFKFLRPSPVIKALEPGPSDWTHPLIRFLL